MPDHEDRRPLVLALLLALLVSLSLASGLHTAANAADSTRPVEDYAAYAPQQYCHPRAKPGTRALAAWLEDTYAGTDVPLPLRRLPTV